jgi:hypothetical protein
MESAKRDRFAKQADHNTTQCNTIHWARFKLKALRPKRMADACKRKSEMFIPRTRR